MRINDQFDENWFWHVLKIDETLMKQRRTLNFMEIDENWWNLMSNYTSWWQPPNPKIDEHWLKSVDARRGLNLMKTAAAENWWKFDENWEFDENVFSEFDEN